ARLALGPVRPHASCAFAAFAAISWTFATLMSSAREAGSPVIGLSRTNSCTRSSPASTSVDLIAIYYSNKVHRHLQFEPEDRRVQACNPVLVLLPVCVPEPRLAACAHERSETAIHQSARRLPGLPAAPGVGGRDGRAGRCTRVVRTQSSA